MNRRSGSGGSGLLIAVFILLLLFICSGGSAASSAFPSLTYFIRWCAAILIKVIIVLVVLMAAIIALIIYLIKNSDKKAKLKKEAELNDPELKDHTSLKYLNKVFTRYKSNITLGKTARSAISQLEQKDKQEKRYRELIESRFTSGSLTAERYMELWDKADLEIRSAYSGIADRMTAFDEADYRKLKSGNYKYDSIPDGIQEEKLALYEQSLIDMRELLEQNEVVLLSFDKLLLKLADSSRPESDIVSEIESLTKQLEYYKNN